MARKQRKPRPSPGEAPPADAAILARAVTFSMDALRAAELQLERAREDVTRGQTSHWSFDMRFFILAMYGLRQGVKIGTHASNPSHRAALESALTEFDAALPGLKTLRDVGEHLDEYAVGAGIREDIRWEQVQRTDGDETTIAWLGLTLNGDTAIAAGRDLIDKLFERRTQEGSECDDSGTASEAI